MSGQFVKVFDSLWQHALSLPLMVLAFSALGRGVGNVVLFLYIVCGIFTVTAERLRRNRVTNVLWFMLMLSFLMSTFYNDAFYLGVKQWVVFSLSSLVMVIVLNGKSNLDHLANNRWLLVILLIPLLVYVGRLSYTHYTGHFNKTGQVNGILFAVLLPFLSIMFYVYNEKRWALLFLIFSGLIFPVLVIGGSRTEVLMTFVSISVIYAFYYKRIWLLAAIPLAFFVVVAVFVVFQERGYESFDGDVEAWANKVSSNRIEIWKRAIEHPPENQLLGTGMDNTMAYLPESKHRAALHNAFLEIWYETGFVGLGIMLMLFTLLLRHMVFVYKNALDKERFYYSIFLASLAAVVTAGMLDKGYNSVIIRFFMFYLGAALFVIGRKAVNQSS